MTTLIGLFKNEKQVETAVQTIAAADLENVDLKTISNWERDREPEMELVTALHSGTSPSGMPVATAMVPTWTLSDEQQGFFKRAVQNGGVLLVADVADEETVPQIRHILEKNSEKVTTSS